MKWILLLTFFYTSFVYGQDRVARVLKVTSSKKYALIKHLSSYDAQVGSMLTLESEMGKSCSVKILKKMQGNRVIINLKTCPFKQQVQRGDWLSRGQMMVEDEFEDLEKDEMEVEQRKKVAGEAMNKHHKNVYLLYNMGSSFEWSGTDTSGGDYTLEEEMSAAIGVGFEYYNLAYKREWGYSLGIEYEFNREVTSATDSNGVDQTPEPKTAYTFLNFFLNATYSLGPKAFVFGGGVLSLPGATDNLVEIGTGYGVQGGFGMAYTDYKFHVGYRFIGYSGTLSSDSTEIDASASLSGFILNGGYSF